MVKRFFRNYSLASLAIIFLAAVAIFMAYRSIVIRGIALLAESSSVTTTRIALHPIRHHLADFLEEANRPRPKAQPIPLPAELEDAIAEVMRDSRVVRLKIYNEKGIVAFSTQSSQTGDDMSSNPGFLAAMDGKTSVKLIYRDHFNAFDESTESDNLVQTYLPVRRRSSGSILGVFETYTDVNALVAQTEHSEILIAIVTALVLGITYAALLMFVARANRVIDDQQRTIREKSSLLEQLSHRNLAREEMDRKRLATDLHEGLAQTLGAVKLLLEKSGAGPQGHVGKALQSIIPLLQNAIRQTREIAMDLSPPGLDDLGLGPTLRGLQREFQRANASPHVDLQIAVQESDIPGSLNIVLYRVVEAVLKLLGDQAGVRSAQIRLAREGDAIVLLGRDDARALVTAMENEVKHESGASPASRIRERVIISGGNPGVHIDAAGEVWLRFSWQL